MKRYLFTITFILLAAVSYGQDSVTPSIHLEYVGNDFPIKIDGAGNFYTYDTVNPVDQKYILVISDAGNWITAKSNTRTAFIKVSGKPDYIYLHAPGKTHADGMDTATFKGKGYVIKLQTRKVRKLSISSDLYKGTMTIEHNKKSVVIKIQGEVYDYKHFKGQ